MKQMGSLLGRCLIHYRNDARARWWNMLLYLRSRNLPFIVELQTEIKDRFVLRFQALKTFFR